MRIVSSKTCLNKAEARLIALSMYHIYWTPPSTSTSLFYFLLYLSISFFLSFLRTLSLYKSLLSIFLSSTRCTKWFSLSRKDIGLRWNSWHRNCRLSCLKQDSNFRAKIYITLLIYSSSTLIKYTLVDSFKNAVLKRNTHERRSKLASKLQVLWGLQLGPLISMDQTSLVEKCSSTAGPPHAFA